MHNDCVSCNYLGVEDDVKESQCITKCSNREMKIDKYGKKVCALKECPDKHIVDAYHECWSCDMEYPINVDSLECDKCPNRKMITTPGNYNYCVLKECPEGKIMDAYGECYTPRT